MTHPVHVVVKLAILSFIIFTISACSTPTPVHFNKVSVDSNQRTLYSAITPADKLKISKLANDISQLSATVDKKEAYLVAYEAVLYPKLLANRYQLMSPPHYHNKLVSLGIRQRGLCYHFAQDMTLHLNRPYKTLTLERVMAYHGKPDEHHVPSIRAKGQPLREAIALDAWINSASLSWVKVKDDNGYPWVQYVPRKAEDSLVLSKKEATLVTPDRI